MNTLKHQETNEGIHIVEIRETVMGEFSSKFVIDMLNQIYQQNDDDPVFILYV